MDRKPGARLELHVALAIEQARDALRARATCEALAQAVAGDALDWRGKAGQARIRDTRGREPEAAHARVKACRTAEDDLTPHSWLIASNSGAPVAFHHSGTSGRTHRPARAARPSARLSAPPAGSTAESRRSRVRESRSAAPHRRARAPRPPRRVSGTRATGRPSPANHRRCQLPRRSRTRPPPSPQLRRDAAAQAAQLRRGAGRAGRSALSECLSLATGRGPSLVCRSAAGPVAQDVVLPELKLGAVVDLQHQQVRGWAPSLPKSSLTCSASA
jgi:hypothetical protein